MDNQPTRISDKCLSLHSAKIRITNELFQFIQELHLNRSTIGTLNSFTWHSKQQAYSSKTMAEYINTRPDHEQTRDFSKYQLKRYPNQEPYLFKKCKKPPFSKMPKSELEIHHQLVQDLQFNSSKIRIENSPVGIPRKPL